MREDFGVEIDIDLAPLGSADEPGSQPAVAGRIRYGEGDEGILLYIKPTMVGGEPRDVQQYRARNSDFPHESTTDQFYDEAQWEAYRRLGEHIVCEALEPLLARGCDDCDPAGASEARARFIRGFFEARYTWPPAREDDHGRLGSLAREWDELEQELADSGPPALRADIFGVPKTSGGDADGSAVETLTFVQRALHLMQAVCTESGMLDRPEAPSHPRYRGWLNRVGRWVSSTQVRAWWPWLLPHYPRRFRRFLKHAFELPEHYDDIPQPDLQRLDKKKQKSSYTWDRWGTTYAAPKSGDLLLGLFLPLRPGSSGDLIAIVVLRPDSDSAGKTGARSEINAWSLVPLTSKRGHRNHPSRSIYVPPGLWGIGVGERFARELTDRLHAGTLHEALDKPERIDRLTVRVSKGDVVSDSLWAGCGFARRKVRGKADIGGPAYCFVLDALREGDEEGVSGGNRS